MYIRDKFDNEFKVFFHHEISDERFPRYFFYQRGAKTGTRPPDVFGKAQTVCVIMPTRTQPNRPVASAVYAGDAVCVHQDEFNWRIGEQRALATALGMMSDAGLMDRRDRKRIFAQHECHMNRRDS